MSDPYEALLLKKALERKEHLLRVAERRAVAVSLGIKPPSFSSPLPLIKPAILFTPIIEKQEPKFIRFDCNKFVYYATGTYQDDFHTYIVQNDFGSYECSQYPKDEDQIQIGLSRDPYLREKGVIISTYLLTNLPLHHNVQVEYKRVVPFLRIHSQLLPFANYLWEPKERTLNEKIYALPKELNIVNCRTVLYCAFYYYFLMVFYIPPILFYFFMGVLSSVSCFVRPPE